VEHGLPLVRGVARLASRPRAGRSARAGSRRPGAGHAAATRRRLRSRVALLFQGSGPDPRRHAGDREASPHGGAHGRPVEIGARTRTIPPALRRALCHRDRTCRFPGCEVRVGQAHHVHHWAQGGPTTLSSLVLLCRRHHRAVHEEGYRVARAADGTLRFARPDGRPLPDVPPAPACPRIRSRRWSDGTPPMAFGSTRARHAPRGSVSDSTSAGRSMSCIRSRGPALC
jgi:HNH endonuclease